MLISHPMLAGTVKDTNTLKYPLAATYKLDGIRCLCSDTGVISRTFKPIANKNISKILSQILPVGIDGEIMAGSNFQEVTHAVMSQDGEPEFYYNIFDYVKDSCEKPYMSRISDLIEWYATLDERCRKFIKILIPEIINNEVELLAFEEKALDLGYEGVILRSLDSPYKNGRATMKEGYLLKLKRFLDSEATILGFEELMNNNNVATKDAFGRSERSSHRANLANAGTMGAILVEDINTKQQFKIGTGFDANLRAEIWLNQANYLGRLAKYKYFPVGVKDAPRHPVFLGIRDESDM
jgi:DNA ligase-1